MQKFIEENILTCNFNNLVDKIKNVLEHMIMRF